MADMRKSNPREYVPSLTGGSQTTSGGGTNSDAKKDSLIGSATNKEYKPGKLPMGGGELGGKGKSL